MPTEGRRDSGDREVTVKLRGSEDCGNICDPEGKTEMDRCGDTATTEDACLSQRGPSSHRALPTFGNLSRYT